jgi:molecular chaperone GrpE
MGRRKKKKIKVRDANEQVQEAEAEAGAPEETPAQESAQVESTESSDKKAGSKADQKAQVSELHDKYLRAVAELENYKKRVVKERSELLKYAGQHLAHDLLEVVDNLERALSGGKSGNHEDHAKGVELIAKQFIDVLGQHSIRAEDSVGKPFNPEVQQAMAMVETDECESGTVIEEYKKTYFFKDRLLRPGQVVVAAQPAEQQKEGEEEG